MSLPTRSYEKTQYCPVGHDTFALGRAQGQCRECRRAADHRRYAASKKHRYSQAGMRSAAQDPLTRIRVSFAPFETYLRSRGYTLTHVLDMWEQRYFYRGRASGYLSVGLADEWSIRLGCHPSEIWGEEWWA